VLRLPPTATWEEIVANYRRLARWWHPDGLGAAAEWGRAACEDKIRQLNAAYSELRIRRGR
jgi:curved DNA-binding protein CbpA